jgi:hypothetical protein
MILLTSRLLSVYPHVTTRTDERIFVYVGELYKNVSTYFSFDLNRMASMLDLRFS